MPEKENKMSVPNELLERINEFSTGGYAIFIKDVNGEISIIEKYDTSVDALGVRKFIHIWGNMMEEENEEMIRSSLFGENDPEDFEEED